MFHLRALAVQLVPFGVVDVLALVRGHVAAVDLGDLRLEESRGEFLRSSRLVRDARARDTAIRIRD